MTDTPSTEALDALWFDLFADALSSDGPISDADVKNAVKRARPKIEDQARAEGRQQAVREIREQINAISMPLGFAREFVENERKYANHVLDRVAGLTSEGSAAQRNASESPPPDAGRISRGGWHRMHCWENWVESLMVIDGGAGCTCGDASESGQPPEAPHGR